MRYHFIFQHLLEGKKDMLISIGEAMEKSDPSYTTGEIVKWCVYFGEETW